MHPIRPFQYAIQIVGITNRRIIQPIFDATLPITVISATLAQQIGGIRRFPPIIFKTYHDQNSSHLVNFVLYINAQVIEGTAWIFEAITPELEQNQLIIGNDLMDKYGIHVDPESNTVTVQRSESFDGTLYLKR